MRFKRVISNHAGGLAILLGLHGFAFAAGAASRKLSHSNDQKVEPSKTVNALLITNATLLGVGAGLLVGFLRPFSMAPKDVKKLLRQSTTRIFLVPTVTGALIANSVIFATKKGYEFEFKSSKQEKDRCVNSLN